MLDFKDPDFIANPYPGLAEYARRENPSGMTSSDFF